MAEFAVTLNVPTLKVDHFKQVQPFSCAKLDLSSWHVLFFKIWLFFSEESENTNLDVLHVFIYECTDILQLKSSEEEIAVEGVQGSCLLSLYQLSAEIGYWAHFSQYQCTENCSQKHQHLHPLNTLRKVLIKINDKTPFSPFPLEYRGGSKESAIS